MSYSLKNAASTAPAETISDEQHATLKAAGKLAGYEVTKVVHAHKPAELASETAAHTKTPKHKAE